jgi:hypothetical protein
MHACSLQRTGLPSPAARIMPRGSERGCRGPARSLAACGGGGAGASVRGCPGANSTMRRAGARRATLHCRRARALAKLDLPLADVPGALCQVIAWHNSDRQQAHPPTFLGASSSDPAPWMMWHQPHRTTLRHAPVPDKGATGRNHGGRGTGRSMGCQIGTGANITAR